MLPVDLVSRRAGQQLYAHVMGLWTGPPGKWFFLSPDAKTRVDPGSSRRRYQHGNPSAPKWITIPAMDSGRIHFSVGQALKFFVNPVAAHSCHRWPTPNRRERSRCLTLDTATGRQTVGGLVPTGLETITAGLRTQATVDNTGWRDLDRRPFCGCWAPTWPRSPSAGRGR